MELVAGPPAAHHVSHVARRLHQLRDSGIRGGETRPQGMPVYRVSRLHCLECDHDDHDGYQRSLYWAAAQRLGEWIFHDVLAALVRIRWSLDWKFVVEFVDAFINYRVCLRGNFLERLLRRYVP